MRLICARYHYPRGESIVCETFWAWVLHQAMHSFWLRHRLIRIGFLDCEDEGSVLFWRWDYYNARAAACLREHERKAWERKRDAARDRWGETAG
jgi:hypothetical protein